MQVKPGRHHHSRDSIREMGSQNHVCLCRCQCHITVKGLRCSTGMSMCLGQPKLSCDRCGILPGCRANRCVNHKATCPVSLLAVVKASVGSVCFELTLADDVHFDFASTENMLLEQTFDCSNVTCMLSHAQESVSTESASKQPLWLFIHFVHGPSLVCRVDLPAVTSNNLIAFVFPSNYGVYICM